MASELKYYPCKTDFVMSEERWQRRKTRKLTFTARFFSAPETTGQACPNGLSLLEIPLVTGVAGIRLVLEGLQLDLAIAGRTQTWTCHNCRDQRITKDRVGKTEMANGIIMNLISYDKLWKC